MKRLSITRTAWGCFAIILSVTVGFIYYVNNPTDSVWFPKCPFKLLTGLSCPGCGIQRAVHALLNGRYYDALSYNYFFVISIPYTIVVCIAYGLHKLHKSERLSELLEHRSLAMLYVYSFFAWFVIRNIFGI